MRSPRLTDLWQCLRGKDISRSAEEKASSSLVDAVIRVVEGRKLDGGSEGDIVGSGPLIRPRLYTHRLNIKQVMKRTINAVYKKTEKLLKKSKKQKNILNKILF